MTYQHITKHTSKNYTPASLVAGVFGQPRRITTITIHHWGLTGQKFENVVNFLCTNNTPTSAHYVVEAGKVATLVAPNDAAWHTGSAAGNATSIGLELRPEATDGDYATAAELIRELRAVYGDLPLVPHKQWFNTACPGKWDLKRLDKLARTGTTVQPAASIKPVPTPAKPADPLEEIMSYYKNKQEFREDLAGLIKKYTVRATFRDMFDKRDTNVAQALRAIEKITRETREIAEASAKKAGLTTAEIAAAAERGAAKGAAEALADGVDIDVTINGKEIK